MSGVLDGRPAIVTGGGQGVGRGIAKALAAEGAPVAVLGRTESKLVDACEEINGRGDRAIPVVCDIRELDRLRSAVDTVVEQLGPVRILVNNALMIPHGTLLDIEEETVDDAWRSGPLAALRLMRLCHPHLRDGGVVVNVTSGAGFIAGPPGLGIYGTVKAAHNAINRAAAEEFAADGIRVNALAPMAMSPAFDEWEKHDPDGFAQVLTNVPLKRLGDPEADIGRAAVFLCGPDSSFVTGTTLPVDGGALYLR
jgi:NAD(P)-dependent dehydrogenase (short-subunit alcohol dehydrogenase family)